jgi:hypothetical protein
MRRKSFAFSYPKGTKRIMTMACVRNAITNEQKKIKALWDTGATDSLIVRDVAKQMGFWHMYDRPVSHINGVDSSSIFLGDICLPGDIWILHKKLLSCNSVHDFDLIVGMDIIAKGRFLIEARDESVEASFHWR